MGGGRLPGNQPPPEMVSSYHRPAVQAAPVRSSAGCPPPEGTAGALPFPVGSWLPASPFQTRSGDPPSAPEASAEVGTLVLAPESDIPEAPRNSLPTSDSWQGLGGGAGRPRLGRIVGGAGVRTPVHRM